MFHWYSTKLKEIWLTHLNAIWDGFLQPDATGCKSMLSLHTKFWPTGSCSHKSTKENRQTYRHLCCFGLDRVSPSSISDLIILPVACCSSGFTLLTLLINSITPACWLGGNFHKYFLLCSHNWMHAEVKSGWKLWLLVFTYAGQPKHFRKLSDPLNTKIFSLVWMFSSLKTLIMSLLFPAAGSLFEENVPKTLSVPSAKQ